MKNRGWISDQPLFVYLFVPALYTFAPMYEANWAQTYYGASWNK